MSTPPDENAAYHELARIFSARRKDNNVLEIEILPPGLGPLLQDGNSVGLTKKYLVQAFVTARRIFFDASNEPFYFSDASGHEDERKAPQNESLLQKRRDGLLNASEIILLFDCEHLTACSWRKRRLAALSQRAGSADAGYTHREMLIRELDTEMSLLTTYICSPLHRHTKSPTLYNHRLWVLRQMLSDSSRKLAGREDDEEIVSSQKVLEKEVSIVLRSGELHPKNYYGFTYLRQLLDILSGSDEDQECASARLAALIIPEVLDWCLAHPSDISGWMFTLRLLDSVRDEETRTDCIDRVLRFALNVGWEGESIWTFVNLATKMTGVGASTKAQCKTLSNALANLPLSEVGAADGWKGCLERARAAWVAGQQADQRHGPG
ncbi:hypothetical protein CBS115989_584 [Aspergillus niger]|uniref:Contig An04c0040, genomic contig n=3 Tax=Aspergillus niger TaxID=5061 RepID=A2QHQ2_ASPNC|nr:uncharacterized protein An04g00660 [Aspergillus niger]RDH21100.1 hypothetical protein M747DRAFT_369969 [Aspergillus niger ATCC 13496]KAI2824627.1 hypothetical protein CBS115989_584 [Aspergillus niger]KAI2850937.1 hypothetical protein CBS11350_1529 [Aspergillus niger]KAI2860653.1 hypothetical protein CBS11232_1503 [Aspergillus niger]KAI2867761.1 hypothetical protein CBS12448_207 [Aspergillus niger]|eukprot:XP_001401430.1 hypothetical protein ANI_1_1554184 [Aspergillus niger CBS 513.88]